MIIQHIKSLFSVDYVLGLLLAISILRQPFLVICSYAFIDGTIYIYPIYIVAALIAFICIFFKRKIFPKSFLLCLPIVFIVLVSCFWGDKQKLLSENFGALFFFYIVSFIVSQYIRNQSKLNIIINIFLIAYYSLGVIVFYLFRMTGRYYGADAMTATYAIGLPTAAFIYLCLIGTSKFNLIYYILAATGVIMSFLCGSRGIIVVYAVATFLGIRQLKSKKILTAGIIVSVLLIMYFSEDIETLFLNTRFSDTLDEGFTSDSGRGSGYFLPSWNAFLESPLWGWGTFGDRLFIAEQKWSHNLILEILCDYGLIFGGTFLVWLTRKSFKYVYINKNRALVILFIISVPHLLISSSFLLASNLWIYVGLLISKAYGQISEQGSNTNGGFYNM